VGQAGGEALPLYVGVNLSRIQVARDNIAEVVESALRSSGLKGDRLTLELTKARSSRTRAGRCACSKR
jgi:EAL domain-containing protein (putative c-di-GMP-specific phosphodiesterase class I)